MDVYEHMSMYFVHFYGSLPQNICIYMCVCVCVYLVVCVCACVCVRVRAYVCVSLCIYLSIVSIFTAFQKSLSSTKTWLSKTSNSRKSIHIS